MTPNFLSNFKCMSLTEIHQAPTGAGVYAWYATPQIGIADWVRSVDGEGVDLGIQSFKGLFTKHSARFAPPSLRVSSHSAFRDRWTGSLPSNSFERDLESITKDLKDEELADSAAFPSKEWKSLLGSEKQRGALSQLFNEIVNPVLSSPLYIGRADNLQSRLKDHASDLGKWHNAVLRDQGHLKKIYSSIFEDRKYDGIPNIFATRAIASGFGPENLIVFALDIEVALDLNTSKAIELSYVLEWFLNTWSRPILGRK